MHTLNTGDRSDKSLDREAILAYFLKRTRQRDRSYVCFRVYGLMRWILENREFDSIESLLAFCSEPDNLKRWLLDNVDRVVASLEITHALRQLVSGPVRMSELPVVARASGPDRASGAVGTRASEPAARKGQAHSPPIMLEEGASKTSAPCVSCS